MKFEPKSVVWKRQAAERVRKQTEGLMLAAELEF